MSASLQQRLRAALQQPARTSPPVRADSVTAQLDLSMLGGRWFESPQGPGYVIESVYEAGHLHGRMPLRDALALDTTHLAAQCRDTRITTCAPGRFLYVDTETTGLGGAGTMVFLAGVARFEGSSLRLKQYLLPAPQYEGGLLGGIASDLADGDALVSYNGKSFDVPALETRYILSRMTPGLRALPHIDLLHPNRRLFRGRFASFKLTQMEEELLGFERESDCPSAEVPERYFAFQRSGDPTHIRPVLRHNAWDILSLVALAAHLAQVCGGDGFPLQAARAAVYAGNHAAALANAETATRTSNRADRLESMEIAARMNSKLARWDEAARWWRSLVEEPRARRVLPLVELAKLLEHRLRLPDEALAVVETALAALESGAIRAGAPGSELTRDALEHRRLRLQRKVGGRPG